MSGASQRVYSGRSAQERDAERIVRLREAALHLFGTEGYPAVAVDRVCAAAKVSTRHFYQLFDNKEDALLDLHGSLTNKAFEDVVTALAASTGLPLPERITNAVSAYLSPAVTHPLAARIQFVEIVGVSPRAEKHRATYRDAMIDLIQHEVSLAAERGEMTGGDIRFAALAFFGALNVVVYDWTLDPRGVSPEDLTSQLAALLVSLLLG